MIEKAPKYVIDDLDNWSENPHNEVCIYALLNDMVDAMTVFVGNTPRIGEKTARWVYAAHRTSSEDLQYEAAVIEHVFGDKRLEIE